jgi:hypothetical protein
MSIPGNFNAVIQEELATTTLTRAYHLSTITIHNQASPANKNQPLGVCILIFVHTMLSDEGAFRPLAKPFQLGHQFFAGTLRRFNAAFVIVAVT